MDSDLTDLNDVTISAEEAVQIGLDYLAQLGETDFAPALIVAGYCHPRGSENHKPMEEWSQCYQIQFTRNVAGVPATYREEHYDGIGSDGRERYAPYYPQESIEMDIRDSGVNYMYWSAPSELGRTLNENVTLMPFEQVVERFCDQILYSATPAVEETDSVIKKTLYIDRIELGMVRALQRGSVEEWVMVPAWTFSAGRCCNTRGRSRGAIRSTRTTSTSAKRRATAISSSTPWTAACTTPPSGTDGPPRSGGGCMC